MSRHETERTGQNCSDSLAHRGSLFFYVVERDVPRDVGRAAGFPGDAGRPGLELVRTEVALQHQRDDYPRRIYLHVISLSAASLKLVRTEVALGMVQGLGSGLGFRHGLRV